MREIRYRELDRESFSRYGAFAAMAEPDGEGSAPPRIGMPPVEFFRDLLQSGLGLDTVASFGVCRVYRRPSIVDASEYHDGACEAILPLDADVVVHVAVGTVPGRFPTELVEAFRVPRGTMLALRPGVWHHGPFVLGAERASCLVALPERLYARDCTEIRIPEEGRVRISGEGLPE